MRRKIKAAGRSERGSVAVEMAIMLPILVVFLGFTSLYWAYYFRQYSAFRKAAHDAALYLATAPRLDLTTAGTDGNFVATTLARRIVDKELAGMVHEDAPVELFIGCLYQLGTAEPQTSSCTPSAFKQELGGTLYRFDLTLTVPYIDPITGTQVESLTMSAITSMRYLGN